MQFDPAETKRIPPPSPMADMTTKERKSFNKSRQQKLARKRKKPSNGSVLNSDRFAWSGWLGWGQLNF
jgi:hypothetical protein